MKMTPASEWKPQGLARLETAALAAVREQTNSLVVAGPGAGKTELLAQRASYLLETGLCPSPYRILAISFKRDAAKNLKDRVAIRCGPDLARRFESYTFDAWAKGLIDRFRLGLPDSFRPRENYYIDSKFTNAAPLRDRLLAICNQAGMTQGDIHSLDSAKFFTEYVSGRAINHTLQPRLGTEGALLAALWNSALHSGSRSILAFPMFGVLAELLLRTNPHLLNALRSSYRYVFLDEFQDTTSSQYRLLHTAFQGSQAILTAVGDTKQRIMIWAGAEIGVFEAYSRDFSAQRHGLVMNYRSAPRLVAIQTHLIEALEPGSPSPSAADDGKDGDGECRLLAFPDDSREAVVLAGMIQIWINDDGLRPTEVCILVRQQPDLYTAILQAELGSRGVASRVQNDFQDLLSEPLTVAVLDFFWVCVRKRSPKEWLNLCEFYLRLRGTDSMQESSQLVIRELSNFLAELRSPVLAATSSNDIEVVIRSILEFVDEANFRQTHEQYLQQDFLDQIIEQICSSLSLYRDSNPDWDSALNAFMGHDCIPIMSIHKSKGLEFHTVILLGLEDYPFRDLTSEPGEEDCTFFVAFSRAKKRILFTTAGARTTRYGLKNQTHVNVTKFYNLLNTAGVPLEDGA